jgi:hypothetical protein
MSFRYIRARYRFRSTRFGKEDEVTRRERRDARWILRNCSFFRRVIQIGRRVNCPRLTHCLEEVVRSMVFGLPIAICLAGCITVGMRDTPEQDLGPDAMLPSANPDSVKIITSDITHFWWAFDEATPADAGRIFSDEYLGRGSAALREFVRLKMGRLDNLTSKIWSSSRYYASLRSSTLSIRSEEERIRESFRNLKQIYADARFPNVYFVIGAMNSGGIATRNGLVIGAELFSKTPASPLDELNSWERTVVQPIDKIPVVVAHELVHYQQQFEKPLMTLLERSIAEGTADFVSEKIAGAQINELQHRYGDQHEEVLWGEFQRAMKGTDYSRWLYNGGLLARTGQIERRPADLGYYVGYKICQAYYDRAVDKKKAVKEMLEINDFEEFLRESGYGSRFSYTARPTDVLTLPDTSVHGATSETTSAIANSTAH